MDKKDKQIAELQRQFARMKNDREFYYRKYGETTVQLGDEIRLRKNYRVLSIILGLGLVVSIVSHFI